MTLLAIDPGREKCGVAVCGPAGVFARHVIPVQDLRHLSERLAKRYAVDRVIVGNQTNHEHAFAISQELGLPVELVHERDSTLRARRRYFEDHPRRGWRRLLPLGLQTPPEPYDDYAAIVLAEDYLGIRALPRPEPAGAGPE